jgi:hypothetical protein
VFYWTFGVGWLNSGMRFACGFISLHAVKVEQKVEHWQEKRLDEGRSAY